MASEDRYRIFVKVMEAGAGMYRPVVARQIDRDIFEIVEGENEMPDDETWEFQPGQRVVCGIAENPEGQCFVAVKLAD